MFKKKQKILVGVLSFGLALGLANPAFATEVASPTSSTIYVDGQEIEFEAYNINGNNYFKLRDVAWALSGTDSQFNVTWNDAEGVINLIDGEDYGKNGVLSIGNGKVKSATLNTAPIMKDGSYIDMMAYNIEGNNFFKLRDLGMRFDFAVGWDSEANAVIVETREKENVDMSVVENVHFIYDIRTFTLFAFMNYTGFDDNNGYPITGTRAALREDLASMNIDISSPNYYSDKLKTSNFKVHYFDNVLKYLGDAPNFTYYNTLDNSPSTLPDLPAKLSEFYVAADIPTLYEKYREDYETILNQYEKSLIDVAKMVGYFNLTNDVNVEFGVEVNLLNAKNRGTGLGSIDEYHGYGVIRTGPSDSVNVLNILHEYAHGFSDDAVDANFSKMNALSKYYNSNCDAAKQGYTNWKSIVHESFVRAISTYFDSTLPNSEKQRTIDHDMKQGFVMTQYIYDRIPEFETFDGDYNAFVGMLLEEYPQYAEQK